MMSRILICALFCSALCSCVSHKELVNFNEQTLPYGEVQAIENAMILKIQPDDLIRITVSSIDPEAAAPFNLDMATASPMGQLNPASLELFQGYLVDRDGAIDLPLLGAINVEGLTIEQLKKKINGMLSEYLRGPVVTARFLNFKVTVLGEVNVPGVVRLTNSRVTVLDVLGMAGDLTSYADRNEVSVIREESDQRSFVRLNLKSKEIFKSDYFYLQQNDVIYVRPIQAKTATVADPGQRIVQYGSALLSVVALIVTLTRL